MAATSIIRAPIAMEAILAAPATGQVVVMADNQAIAARALVMDMETTGTAANNMVMGTQDTEKYELVEMARPIYTCMNHIYSN